MAAKILLLGAAYDNTVCLAFERSANALKYLVFYVNVIGGHI